MTAQANKELLDLAAKAAGYKGWDNDWWAMCDGENHWDPLRHNGQALRLAVKLRLVIKPGKHLGDACTVESQRAGIAGCTAFDEDKAKQMRRAIVVVAAEIGKAMP